MKITNFQFRLPFGIIFKRRYLTIPISIFGLYWLGKKLTIKKREISEKAFEILDSKEVKGAGIDLLEDLFKDKRTLQTVIATLKDVVKDNKFEEDFKEFIKDLLMKVLKDQEFLQTTKSSLIEMPKSKEVTDETAALLKFIADDETAKDTIAKFFKDVFLSDEVFNDLCALFEKGAVNAIHDDKTQNGAVNFGNEVLADKELRNAILSKAVNVFSKDNSNKI